MGCVLPRRPGSAEPEGAPEDQLPAPEIRGEIEVVNPKIDENTARAGLRRTDAPQINGENLIVPNELRQRPNHWIEALRVADEKAGAMAGGGACSEGLCCRGTHGLFDEHVPARRERAGDDAGMRLDRRGHDDHVGARERFGLSTKAIDAQRRRRVPTEVIGPDDVKMAVEFAQHTRVALPHRAEADESYLVASRRPSAHASVLYMPRSPGRPREQKRLRAAGHAQRRAAGEGRTLHFGGLGKLTKVAMSADALGVNASAARIVGRYVLYGEIAAGGMATVHFGRLVGPAGFARPVAIKRLHAQFARDPDFVKMFLDEARLAARIAHPNVIPTIDVVASDGEVFLVMEYVRGVTLAQLARTLRHRGDRMRPLIAVGIVSGILQGLHAAHEAKNDLGERLDLVHRDVSPQNALVGTDGVTRLLDFGVAKASGRLQTTRDGQLKGKLSYMAPEQVKGEPLTRRTDVYAASVVLWEVLTGKRLFYADNEANVLAKVLSGDVPPPSSVAPDLPHALDRTVLRGLEREPSKRYETAREMAAALDACIGVASPTEIGDWVEQTAGEELRERALRIALIERGAAVNIDALPPDVPSSPTAPAPAPARALIAEQETSVLGKTTRHEREPATEVVEPPAFTDPPRAVTFAPETRARRRVVLAAIGSAIVVALVLFWVTLPMRVKGDSATRSLQVDVVATTAATAATATSTAEPSTSSATLSPPPEEAPTIEARPSIATTPIPGAARSRSRRGAGTDTGSQEPSGTGTSGAAGSDCNPPYTADAKGHIHFKPNCL
jgi:serine/threonine protein kinase